MIAVRFVYGPLNGETVELPDGALPEGATHYVSERASVTTRYDADPAPRRLYYELRPDHYGPADFVAVLDEGVTQEEAQTEGPEGQPCPLRLVHKVNGGRCHLAHAYSGGYSQCARECAAFHEGATEPCR